VRCRVACCAAAIEPAKPGHLALTIHKQKDRKTMLLFYSPFHRFVHKVLVAIHETGLGDDVELVPTFPFRNADGEWVEGQYDISMLNPLGKVPTLTADDGTVLYQSQVIVEYLDSISKANKLYPAGGPERFDALRRLGLGDSIFDFAVQMSMEGWRDEGARRLDLYTWLWPKITRSFDFLEEECDGWSDFDIGDVGLLQGISYLDGMATGNDSLPENPCHDWQGRWPKLAAWFQLSLQRPSVQVHYQKPFEGDASAQFHRSKVEQALALAVRSGA